MEYFGFLFLGILLFIIGDIIRLNKATPEITQIDTAKEYFRLNTISLAGAVILGITVLLLGIKGEFGLYEILQLNPVLSCTGSFLIGVGSQALLKQWTGTVSEVKTKGDKVVQPDKS